MSAFIVSVIVILLVIFLIILTEAFINRKLTYIVTTTKDTDDCIEAQIRLLLKQNPTSEIFVIDKSQNDETKKILRLLKRDFPEIHIIKADGS